MAKRIARKKRKCCFSGIGGQAVLEGVMMKNRERYSVAVRKPDGEIKVDVREYDGILAGKKIKEVPFIRGVFNFIDSMIIGVRTLNYSASFYEDACEKEKKDKKPSLMERLFGEKAESIAMGITTALSFALAIIIFMVVPYFISNFFREFIRNSSLTALLEGAVRIAIFMIYVVAISFMKDVHRLYQYHGAEHKCINCIEKGRPLTVANVMRSSREHKRCGTSFMLFVMLVSVVLFFFIRVEHPALRVLIRIALIPVIAGISYELIRLAGRSNNPMVNLLSKPGLMLQKLTTKEPDRDMIAVAIAAVEAVFDWKQYLRDNFGYVFEEEPVDAREDMCTETAED